jgi:SAM-dependent methyltransferase
LSAAGNWYTIRSKMTAKAKPPTFKKSSREMSPSVLRQATIRKLPNRLTGKAEILLPAVPGLVDHYVQGLNASWLALGRKFSPAELEYLTEVLGNTLKQAFDASPYSRVSVKYETDPPPKTSLTWNISICHSTIEDEYAEWVAARTPPLFGSHPDAKLMDLARSLGAPNEVTVLDIGAGTGRNTIALATEGFKADAVELAPAFAKILREDLESRKLDVRVFECSIFDPNLEVPTGHYDLLFLSEVVSHFRSPKQVRALFEAADRLLKPNGILLFNTFTTLDGYKPDDVVRQMSEIMWCCVFPRREIQDAAAGLPFVLLSDESTLEYERAHHTPEEWPPTGWYEGWTAGQDLFDLHASKSPVEMRWFAYRKVQSP